MLRCEFHIPISPTPDFLCRVHYLAASIARNSGLREGEYRIVVTVGDIERVDLAALCPWAAEYPLEWRWFSGEGFVRWWYAGTAYQRYCYDFAAETVVMLDGDVLVTGGLCEAIDVVRGTRKLAAVPGYYSPFYLYPKHLDEASPRAWWERIFGLAGLELPPFTMEHPGWRWMRENQPKHVDELQFSPPYGNMGVVMASGAVMREIGQSLFADYALVESISKTSLSGQIALTMAMVRLGLEWTPLPLRYNFQNIPAIYDANPEEAGEIRVLHFLQELELSRVRDFQSYEAVEAVLARTGLHAVNRFFVEQLAAVHGQVIGQRGAGRG
jgi:hypothetical protein